MKEIKIKTGLGRLDEVQKAVREGQPIPDEREDEGKPKKGRIPMNWQDNPSSERDSEPSPWEAAWGR